MLKVIIGEKGTGKTKALLDSVAEALKAEAGSVVFINKGDRHVYDLNYKVRLIDTNDFVIDSYAAFYGFLCGVISQDFDIKSVFVDSITKIVGSADTAQIEDMLDKASALCDKYEVDMTLTLSMEKSAATEGIKKYI